jgi:hypothetical protein
VGGSGIGLGRKSGVSLGLEVGRGMMVGLRLDAGEDWAECWELGVGKDLMD